MSKVTRVLNSGDWVEAQSLSHTSWAEVNVLSFKRGAVILAWNGHLTEN